MVCLGKEPYMKLFFETSAQASLFLLMLPIGFMLALLIDLAGKTGTAKPILDVLAMLLGFASIGICIILFRDGGLRLYHLLSMLTGMLLYLLGIRAAASAVLKWFKQQFGKKDETDGRKAKEKVE